MFKIDLLLNIFLIELASYFLLIKIFKIKAKFIFILFLQIPNICINALCVFLIESVLLKIFLKVLFDFIIILFVTDSFEFKKIIALFFARFVIICSVAGFIKFLSLWLENLLFKTTKFNFNRSYNVILSFVLVIYIILLFKLIRFLEKNKIIKQFLAKVSLFIMDKHIKFYGLIDSGNSLIAPMTKKPIILVSKNSIKKYLADDDFEYLINTKCYNLKCSTISDQNVLIPILRCEDVEIRLNEECEKLSCLIGLVDEKFENGKFDCLLPRGIL